MPRPANALIVDDESHVRVFLRVLLKQLGIEKVWDAADGTAALAQAAAHQPEVILLDINLPQIGGLEVLAKLKAAHPTIPVVVVSSQSTMKTVMQTRELGAEAYVLKHAAKADVLQMLSDAFDLIAEKSASGAADGARPASPA
jgi:two-component system chemotaxis response regulator CheY